jgi:cytochrome c nitrite reductase small subunit
MRGSVRSALLAAAVLVGIAGGLGVYTFVYAKGYSYITNDPAACANCHIMNEQYSGWLKASHRSVAVCNDCHVPHSFVGKYWTKARNGFWHSYYFTTQTFEEPIRATPVSRAIAGGELPALPRSRRAGDGHAVSRRERRDQLRPLPRLGRAPGALRDERRAIEVRGDG